MSQRRQFLIQAPLGLMAVSAAAETAAQAGSPPGQPPGAATPGATFVEVRDGLAAGDRVVVTEIAAAQVGQKVLVRSESA